MVFVRFHRVHLDKLTVFFLFCGFFRLQPTQSIRLQPTCRIHRQFKYYYMGKNDLVLGRSVAFFVPTFSLRLCFQGKLPNQYLHYCRTAEYRLERRLQRRSVRQQKRGYHI